MVSKITNYPGASYPMDSPLGSETEYIDPTAQASSFGVTTDPRTANQLKAVSDKISTGTGTIEVTGVTAATLESIPEQHLDEINRLRELTGVDLTFHGPLVEPTGLTKAGWEESHRLEAERQMWSAVDRAHKVDPEGNVVVTFHSTVSNIGAEPETRFIDPKTGKEVIKEILIFDEHEGRLQGVKAKDNPLTGEKEDPYEQLAEFNSETWEKQLVNLAFHARNGQNSIQRGSASLRNEFGKAEEAIEKKGILNLYKKSLSEEGKKEMEDLEKLQPGVKETLKEHFNEITVGETYIRDSYNDLQKRFSEAYHVAKREKNEEDKKNLDSYAKELQKKMDQFKDVEKLPEFAGEVEKGVRVLRSLSEAPQLFRPAREFLTDKAADTFANLALKADKKFGESAPIISVENPPAGMGLTRAEHLKEVMDKSRERFTERAVEQGMSEKEAREKAEKLIGVTWDLGHINMIRKFGYDKEALKKETETVAPYVKHVHLSDNFGLEHTELPMGMGNVPTKAHMELINKYNKQAKKIIETGGPWFESFKKTPLAETFQSFGTDAGTSGYWNTFKDMQGAYSTGYGQTLPDQHFQMYGAGFSNLPPELGGQMSGGSRVSGRPME